MSQDYASNSFVSKEVKVKVTTPKKEPVVTAPAKVVKSDKSKNKFLDFAKRILNDYLIPGVKEIVSETLINAVDIAFHGDVRRTPRNGIPTSRVSYNKYYYDSERNYQNRREPQRLEPSEYDYNDILLGSRQDAVNVLARMDESIAQYGWVKVSDLYEFAGLDNLIRYTDTYWGWTDLRSAQIIAQRDGYLLKLPRPMSID